LAKAMAAAPEAIRKAYEEQSERLAKAELDAASALAKADVEYNTRVEREFIAKAADFDALPTTPDEFGPVLRAVSEKAPEAFAEIDRILRAANAALKQGDIYRSIGRDGTDSTGGDAWSQILGKADELRVAHPELSRQSSIAKASELNPELVAAYQKEQRDGV